VLRYGYDGERRGDELRPVRRRVPGAAAHDRLRGDRLAAAVAPGSGLPRLPGDGLRRRPVFATKRRFPTRTEVVVAWPHRYLAAESTPVEVDARTVVCVLTHDPKFRRAVLEGAPPDLALSARGLPAYPRRPSNFGSWVSTHTTVRASTRPASTSAARYRCGQATTNLVRVGEAALGGEDRPGVADRHPVAEEDPDPGDRRGEVDRPEDDHARRRLVRGDEQAELVAAALAVVAVPQHAGPAGREHAPDVIDDGLVEAVLPSVPSACSG